MRFLAIKRLLIVGGLILSTASLLMAAAEPITAEAITKGYATADAKLLPGMVAALSIGGEGDTARIERATPENGDKIVGIATTVNDSLVTIASGNSQAYVESEGGVGAYVSDVNGAPKKGDLLTISPLKGILMRAENSSSFVLAVAEEDFVADKAETYELEGSGPKTTLIQKIRVNLDRRGTGPQNNVGDIQSSLEKLGKLLTGREVGTFRVAMALVVFLLVMLTEGAILYGTISSAITSIGRNPMAHGLIRSELLRVLVVVSLVLIVGLGAIYGILWI